MAETDLSVARESFIEKMGILAQMDGMPRIAGRLFAMLVFDGRRYSFSELAEALQVSRASVSTNVRLLEEREVIRRVAQPGDRQDYFELGEAPYERLLRGAVLRAGRTRASIEETLAELPGREAALVQRLQDYAGLYAAIETSVMAALDSLAVPPAAKRRTTEPSKANDRAAVKETL